MHRHDTEHPDAHLKNIECVTCIGMTRSTPMLICLGRIGDIICSKSGQQALGLGRIGDIFCSKSGQQALGLGRIGDTVCSKSGQQAPDLGRIGDIQFSWVCNPRIFSRLTD
jgi:hypothetical protein